MSRSEAQTRLDLIDPVICAAGWSVIDGSRISVEHPITQGRLVGGGRRAQPLSADYVLIYRNKKLAIIEAKAEKYPISEGRPQAIDYAERLQVRFIYCTNGKGLLQGLGERGYGESELNEVAKLIKAENSDLFDVLAYIAFSMEPITRVERVEMHKAEVFDGHNDKLQAFLEFVLGQYEKQGINELDQAKLPSLLELKYNSTADASAQLGGIPKIRDAFVGFQKYLYLGN
ncbi:MAG: type I restriction enzyme HsdR N-terminal domain-containing protein [Alphaproteobacteria bacterium]|nr:type I restriction enzyme HsdR N-terminal domain-containing protein [Alphaproteobacteria bacterium]